ncbi:MAG: hydrogenase nickel incorporation protein HypB [Spirochaetes bacterium]|nr:hydrogenase nickel incorporation protein HypB [Spirochaetota bacterium]
MASETVSIIKSIYADNNSIAAKINASFTARKIFAVNVLGAPGTGKTSVIAGVIARIKDRPVTVIEGDIESDIDTKLFASRGVDAFQINTHGGCHLDAKMMDKALAAHPLRDNSVVFIENVGNLVCPAEYEIGEHMKLLVVSAAEGSDKPYKYPLAFQKAGIIVLNKADLKVHVDFNDKFFYDGVKAHNTTAKIFEVNAKKGDGIDALAQWLINVAAH